MKSRLIIVVALVAMLSLSLGGCFGNTWTVSFSVPSNYDDWHQEDHDGGLEQLPGIGVRIDRWSLSSPVAFDGDFTATVSFILNTDADSTAMLGICLGDTAGFYPANFIYSIFTDVGNEEYEDWWVEDDGPTNVKVGEVYDSTLPTLLRKGPNVWKLWKTGNNIKVYLNFFKVADFAMTKCVAAKYYINLYTNLLGGGDVIFTGVKVDYKGSIIP
jgi:hypothetical protein